jgi:Raf kinase inhibitor-like YbhB/YbcL family protein
MKTSIMRHSGMLAGIAITLGIFAGNSTAQDINGYGGFQLTSSTFTSNAELPISAILNNQVNGVNTCSANGAAGADRSPELSWSGSPHGSRSYVVVLYDVTAAFTHWGMYNIRPGVMRLPAGAGVAGSEYGLQIGNDFGLGEEYDGPCPPAGVTPFQHQYVFTVYALSKDLALPSSTNFPPNSETLYQALIEAGIGGQILGKASLTGYYSSTPQN